MRRVRKETQDGTLEVQPLPGLPTVRMEKATSDLMKRPRISTPEDVEIPNGWMLVQEGTYAVLFILAFSLGLVVGIAVW